MRGLAKCVLGLALLATAVGCSGGDAGPRDSVTAPNGGGGGSSNEPTTPPSMRTVVYVPIYSGQLSIWTSTLDFNNVTHVNLSFADIDAGGNVRVADPGMAGLIERAHEFKAKVCVAIGGAATPVDFDVMLADGNRAGFVDKLVTFVVNNNLDCLDVDLEGHSVNQYYEAFVTELSAKLKPLNKEMSAAVAAWFGDQITANALASFDFINVMAYDLYYDLKTPMQWSSMEAATNEVNKWVERGMPKERVVFGVPFYGKRWATAGGEPQTIGYNTLLRLDEKVATVDELQTADSIIYLNSRATIQAKAKLAQTYGGIMAWELSQDARGEDSLLKAIRQAVP